MQASFSDLEDAEKKNLTRRHRFLAEIEAVTAWSAPAAGFEPHYPKGEEPSRPPIGFGRILRMVAAQQCFGLPDERSEDAVYDSLSIRRFVGIERSREPASDFTTLLKFRWLLESHELAHKIFDTINAQLAHEGLVMRERTVVDATLIAPPPSTKSGDQTHDPRCINPRKRSSGISTERTHRCRCQFEGRPYRGGHGRQGRARRAGACAAAPR